MITEQRPRMQSRPEVVRRWASSSTTPSSAAGAVQPARAAPFAANSLGRAGLWAHRIANGLLARFPFSGEHRRMVIVAICLFASAAAAGLFMALRILTNKAAPPLGVALVHGGAGAAGLAVLLLVVMSMDGFGAPGLALTVLGTNALLGFFLFSCHLRRRPWPKPLVLLHGAAALTGFGILLYFVVAPSQ